MKHERTLFFDETSSTQDEARRLVEQGETGPVWILARRQGAGRGRRGREWVSQAGNLYASLLLTPEAPARRLPELSFVAVLAAHKAICALAMKEGRPDIPERLALKWPNDLLLDERKIGGILLESHSAGFGSAPVVIGWGVNLAHAPGEARWPATALVEHGLDAGPEVLLAALQGSFGRWFRLWRAKGFAPVREAWMKRAWGLGRRLSVEAGKERLVGIFRGLGGDGAMLLELPDGTLMEAHAGDVAQMREEDGT